MKLWNAWIYIKVLALSFKVHNFWVVGKSINVAGRIIGASSSIHLDFYDSRTNADLAVNGQIEMLAGPKLPVNKQSQVMLRFCIAYQSAFSSNGQLGIAIGFGIGIGYLPVSWTPKWVAYYDGDEPNPLKSMQMSSMTVLIRLSGTSLCISLVFGLLKSMFCCPISLKQLRCLRGNETTTLYKVIASCHLIFKIEFKACFYLTPNGMKINVLLSKRPICCLFTLSLSQLKILIARSVACTLIN